MLKSTYPFIFSLKIPLLRSSSSILFSTFGFGIGEICVNSKRVFVWISNNANPMVFVDTSSPNILGESFTIFFTIVNYPTTKDGWASGITDSPNGNASSCFCLMSDSIP